MHVPGRQAARLAFFGLFALQHRGQESAGITAANGPTFRSHKAMGLVTQVFDEATLAPLVGDRAIGHTRYSTAGDSDLANAQPFVVHTSDDSVAVAHNGNVTNAAALRQTLAGRGTKLSSGNDSEVLTHLLATPAAGAFEERITRLLQTAEGAYSLVVLTRDAIFGVRDPRGFRPLCLGRLPNGGSVIASESCAFGPIGATFEREIAPGEVVRIDAHGVHSRRLAQPPARTLCAFEHVYFARPDSIIDDQRVHAARYRLGQRLAVESPAPTGDVVIPVPDSALPAALGFADVSGIPYAEGLIKNRYIGRTFIQPGDELRKRGVRLKFNPLPHTLRDKRVVLVDDSIVRGNTSRELVRLVRKAGATEVHMRISSPPVRHPCYMGVDMPTREELIAHSRDVDSIAELLEADSLRYLSLEGMLAAVQHEGGDRGHCAACFSGRYPLEIRP